MEFNDDILHVFVIDDDEFLLTGVKRSLETAGYKVTTSNNVHDAYFKLNLLKPDLILLDVIMPDINGIEFMSLLNSEFLLSDIPIVLMSYLDKEELQRMGHLINNANFIPKPFNFHSLSSKIKRIHATV